MRQVLLLLLLVFEIIQWVNDTTNR